MDRDKTIKFLQKAIRLSTRDLMKIAFLLFSSYNSKITLSVMIRRSADLLKRALRSDLSLISKA